MSEFALVASEGSSIRAYARHRGCSHRAVQKAITAGRLSRAVIHVAGVAKISDFTIADSEWEANTQHLKNRQFGRTAPTHEPSSAPVVFALERFEVSEDGAGNVVLWVQMIEGDDSEAAWLELPTTSDTARALAEALQGPYQRID